MRLSLLQLGAPLLAVACGSSGGSTAHSDAGQTGTGNPHADAGPTRAMDAGPTILPADDAGGDAETYGTPYTGGVYNLGPVDYQESVFHNACAPGTKYDPRVQAVEGDMLAGLWSGVTNVANYCDACIFVTTAAGKTAMLRVVTYGTTTANSIDTSQNAYDTLSAGEYPRNMSWSFAKCPDTGPMLYEFQTASNAWWTSLWVRNARLPLSTVEVQSPSATNWTALTRGSDGSLTLASGFGTGPFSIRSTAVNGQQVVENFAWPDGGVTGTFLTGTANFE